MSQNSASGSCTLRDLPGDHVARVERQLGLKESRAHSSRDAGDRVVRGDHNVLAAHPSSVGLDSQRLLEELLGPAVFENVAALRLYGFGNSSEILARMKPGLIAEPDARSARTWHVVDKLRFEAKLLRKGRVQLQCIGLFCI